MSKAPTRFAVPLTREDEEFLGRMQMAHARYSLRCPAIPMRAAVDEATALVESFRAAIAVGELLVEEPCVITRELAAGIVPEEFQDGPVFHPSLKGLK
jgi:hypothetical protein